MSHKASHYVKHLVKAPDGSRINSTEKAILCQLADDHREESGVAFPSMKSLARRSCTSERNCRRVIAGLEARGVLLRTATRRKDGGGQSSNFYVFCELDTPEAALAAVENGLEALKVPRRLMSGGGGQHAPGGADTVRRGGRTARAPSPGHTAPPIEHLSEPSCEPPRSNQSELCSPISPSQASGERDANLESTNAGPSNLNLARIAFEAAADSVHDALMRLTPPAFEKRRNFRNGAVEWNDYRFGDLAIESCEANPVHGLVLTVNSPDPAATGRGLEKYKSRWTAALQKAFGQSVRLVVRADANRAISSTGTERAELSIEVRKSAGAGELVSLASIAADVLGKGFSRSAIPGVGGPNL